MTKKKQNSNNPKKSGAMVDWISSLAKKQVAAASASTDNNTTLPKEERKQKRAAKKARRQQKQDLKRPPPSAVPSQAITTSNSTAPRPQIINLSKRRLQQLTAWCRTLADQYYYESEDRRPLEAEATKLKKKKLTQESLQPRNCDYSGIGLARESLWIPFSDPSLAPKLEEEFQEHIPGFFGKQRTKAMKKQLDGNMLWRKIQDQKKLKMPKKLQSMSTDQRVQAMMDMEMLI
jgi:hypothetical protein